MSAIARERSHAGREQRVTTERLHINPRCNMRLEILHWKLRRVLPINLICRFFVIYLFATQGLT